jgi:copper resistance protein B
MSILKMTEGEARVRARPEFKPLALTVLVMVICMAQASHAEVPTDHDMTAHSSTAPTPAKAKEKANVKIAGKDDAATLGRTMDHSQMQGMDHGKMEGMDHSQMEGMDHDEMEGMDHSQMQGMDHGKMDGMDHGRMQGMDHGKMDGMNHGRMQGGSAPANARDPDYSDGVGPGPMHGMQHMHGESVISSIAINRLEQFHGDDANGQAIDAQAWRGSDLNKLWFKLDGERSDGRLGATRTELLWDRAISPYWSMQVGARHDFGEGPGRNWAAFGFQGLSPYWFEVEATAYLGESGRTALRVEADYELLLTQRLILQPDVELNVYGKDDPSRDIGAGLSDIDVGLRLRYEITRKFAPYAGVVWSRKFGKTADIARTSGGEISDTQLVAGLRLWF